MNSIPVFEVTAPASEWTEALPPVANDLIVIRVPADGLISSIDEQVYSELLCVHRIDDTLSLVAINLGLFFGAVKLCTDNGYTIILTPDQ